MSCKPKPAYQTTLWNFFDSTQSLIQPKGRIKKALNQFRLRAASSSYFSVLLLMNCKYKLVPAMKIPINSRIGMCIPILNSVKKYQGFLEPHLTSRLPFQASECTSHLQPLELQTVLERALEVQFESPCCIP